jgi:heme oxygenase
MHDSSTLVVQPIIERLRAATRAAHASIQSVPALQRLLAPDLTRREYVRVLLRLHAFRAALEPQLALHLPSRSKAGFLLDAAALSALEDDLTWFGEAPLSPPCLWAPECATSALGSLYVIEGSNLGGRVIGRHVSVALGIGPGKGGSFYCGLSAQDARERWQALLGLFNREIDEPGAGHEPVIRAALKTFEALEEWTRSG